MRGIIDNNADAGLIVRTNDHLDDTQRAQQRDSPTLLLSPGATKTPPGFGLRQSSGALDLGPVWTLELGIWSLDVLGPIFLLLNSAFFTPNPSSSAHAIHSTHTISLPGPAEANTSSRKQADDKMARFQEHTHQPFPISSPAQSSIHKRPAKRIPQPGLSSSMCS